MRRMIPFLVFACVALFNTPAAAQSDMQVAEEVIALARAQWAAEVANESAAISMQSVADEYTQFDSGFPTRLDGKDLNMRITDGFASGVGQLVAADMVNEKVQVHGDVAILSYNFIGLVKDKDGVVEPVLAKSTRVYARMDGSWMLVHANFAPVN
jgi:ketosteroid isomerase-like protein